MTPPTCLSTPNACSNNSLLTRGYSNRMPGWHGQTRLSVGLRRIKRVRDNPDKRVCRCHPELRGPAFGYLEFNRRTPLRPAEKSACPLIWRVSRGRIEEELTCGRLLEDGPCNSVVSRSLGGTRVPSGHFFHTPNFERGEEMSTLKKLICASMILIFCAGAAYANWSDSFDGGKLNLSWTFVSFPQVTVCLKVPVPWGNDTNVTPDEA